MQLNEMRTRTVYVYNIWDDETLKMILMLKNKNWAKYQPLPSPLLIDLFYLT